MIKLGWYREQINQEHQHHTTFREKKISAEVKTRQINTSCICGVQSFNNELTNNEHVFPCYTEDFFLLLFFYFYKHL